MDFATKDFRTRVELDAVADDEDAAADDLDGQIVAAMLRGDDPEAKRLTERADDARARARRARLAAEEAGRREADALIAEQAARRGAAVAAADKACRKLVETAGHVDAAMLALGTAWERLELARLDALRALRLAGMPDTRISNTLPAAARWAIAMHAEGIADAVGVPRTPTNRRRALRESVGAMLPALGVANAGDEFEPALEG